MNEPAAVKRAKERLGKVQSHLSSAYINLAEAEKSVLSLREEIEGLEHQKFDLEYIIKGEGDQEPAPTPKHTRRKPPEPANGVTTIKGKWECHNDECENHSKMFVEAKVLATGHKAGKPLCPKCLQPATGTADVPDGARG